jgi:putative phosphoribosyl transferase
MSFWPRPSWPWRDSRGPAQLARSLARRELRSLNRRAARVAEDSISTLFSFPSMHHEDVQIGALGLPGLLTLPPAARGIVAFVHGSGSSRLSPRNRHVAALLNEQGLATLLFDLLDDAEAEDRRKVFDIALLARRVDEALALLRRRDDTHALPVGLFGVSTGAAAALCAAAAHAQDVSAVVSRGGRPDLAGAWLGQVRAPTLLVVGGLDCEVLELNRQAFDRLQCIKRLDIVPGATHLFEEPGALDQVARLAATWFVQPLALRAAR